MVPDGDVLIFCRVGDDFDKPSHLGLGIQGHAEELCQRKKKCGQRQKQAEKVRGGGAGRRY